MFKFIDLSGSLSAFYGKLRKMKQNRVKGIMSL